MIRVEGLSGTASINIIRARLSAAAATTNPRVYLAYLLRTGNAVERLDTQVNLNGVTNVTLLAAPGVNEVQDEIEVRVANIDTAAVTIILEYYDGTTATQLGKAALAVDETAIWD